MGNRERIDCNKEFDKAFSFNNVSFSYGENLIIDNLSCDINKGKITTLIGANGSGKSTLFNLMTRALNPEKGTIFFENKNITSYRPREFSQKIAIVHQHNIAPPDLTVRKLIGYGRTPYMNYYGIWGKHPKNQKNDDIITRAMEITDIKKYENTPVSNLSGGQIQRVWIAMALAQETKVLLLDEPTTFLNVRHQLEILKLAIKLNKDYGMTIVMLLHDINQALHYSHKIVGLKKGRIVVEGTPSDVISEEVIWELYDTNLRIKKVDEKPFVLQV